MSGRAAARFGRIAGAVALLLAAVVVAPELLAFPHQAKLGRHRVHSETPITPALARLVARADARVSASALAEEGRAARIFLTQGGWRWRLLTLGASSNAFAITRPLGEPIIVNRSSAADDTVRIGRGGAGERTLSGVLAHEMAHGLVRGRFGLLADRRHPQWLIEGYCDHVAGESNLNDAEARALQAAGEVSPALVYYLGRRRVAAALARPGATVDTLFARHRRW